MILSRIEQLDKALFRQLFSWSEGRNMASLSLFCSRSGDGWPYLIFAACLFLYNEQHELKLLTLLALGFLIERPVYYLCKNSFQRTRPCDCDVDSIITPSDKFSLPSGHSAAAWLFTTLVGHFYPALAPFLFIWASGVALSRVLLGVHYPADIIIGSLMGYSCGLMVLMLAGIL